MRDDLTYKIYAIVCPITNAVRYVGKTTREDVRIRVMEHFNTPSYSSNGISVWLKSLDSLPKVAILEVCKGEEKACIAEKKWVRKMKEDGCDLFNVKLYATKAELKVNGIEVVDLSTINPKKSKAA